MPYRINVTLLDIGGLFVTGAVPPLSGTLRSVLPGTTITFPIDAAIPIPMAPMSLLYPAATSGAFPASLIVNDTAAVAGQWFRSGTITLPPQPAPLTVITAASAIPAAVITAMASGLSGSQISTVLGDGWKVLLGIFGAGPPEFVTVTAATITLTAGALTLSITGTARYRFFFIVPFTQAFTLATTMTVVPSADAVQTGRVVAVTATGTTLRVNALTLPIPMLNGQLGSMVEAIFNRAIRSSVDTTLAGMTSPMRLTTTCVVSARRVTIAATGITMQVALGDFGSAIVALPRDLVLSINPSPVANISTAYTFHVADRSTQTPIVGATVTLTNRSPTATMTATTDAQGNAKITAVLRSQVIPGNTHAGTDDRTLQPFAIATAPGASAVTLPLPLVEIT